LTNPFKEPTIKELKRQIESTIKKLNETNNPAVKRGLEAILRSTERSLKFWEEKM
jgi:hypothetical protein